MRDQTTIRVFKDQIPWIKKCCDHYQFGTAEFIEKFERNVKAKKIQEFYNSLPAPQRCVIKEKKIKSRPYKICILKGMAT